MTTHRAGEGGAVTKRMSAEERADRLMIEACCQHFGNGKPAKHTCPECVASAIRSAEAEAAREAAEEMRERAVGVLFACWCDDYGGMTKDEAANTSEVRLIRSLSSSPREGGK